MKVDIAHGEKREGLIFRTTYYTVTVKVTFSETERQVIKQLKLGPDILLEREPPANIKNGGNFNLSVKDILKGQDTYLLDSPVSARAYEENLMNALKNLKNFIEVSAEGTPQKRSYEL